jgi:hypothetical protein
VATAACFLLQADHVRLGCARSAQQVRQPPPDIVDVEARDLHGKGNVRASPVTGEIHMSKLRFALLVVAVLPAVVAGAAVAQGPTDEQRAACQADFDRLCAGTAPGGGRIIACLKKQYDQLSESCRKLIDANKKE